ncbi:MAG: TrkH family potassium uptake protein [Lachnospiraceae bacterium]|nr:TrkH family potassium uptake protein [Lachnospiraceae bacterium]
MNGSVIFYIQGKVVMIEGFLLLLPCLIAVIYREKTGVYFLAVSLICLLAGWLLSRKKPENTVFYLKEGCLITAMSWIILSIFGCLPFVISREIPSFTNALFETISGFTTTGASILSDVENLSKCTQFWRSFTHWIGGMGVLVFLLAIIPLNGGSNFNLMRAESPGPSVGKLVPRLKSTAQLLYIIYFALTLMEILLLIISGMPVFDSFTLSFGTAGTGGFGVRNDSIASYSHLQQWIITVFMLFFGVNFNVYYLIVFKEFKKAFSMEEIRVYFSVVLISVASITIALWDRFSSFWDNLRISAFQVASIVTTTGYCTADFDVWPTFCKLLLVLLMFCGGCAGSTAGGIKVSRFVIGMKTVRKELASFIHPKSIKKIQMDDKPIEHEVVRSTNVYFLTFTMTFVISMLLISIDKEDIVTCFTAVAATLNNVGPGLSMVGPTQNYGHFSMLSKYVMMFDMLAGRLELFPLLIMFHPALWKDLSAMKGSKKKGGI